MPRSMRCMPAKPISLIGTQMLAKGHDFPRLNCVVALEADTGLFSVDFRAEERLSVLPTQVAAVPAGASNPAKC